MPQTAETCPGADDYHAFARGGDPAMLERALRACADRAYTQARRTLGNATDADDAVQEAFLQLVRSAPRFDGTVPFGAWLGQLVRTACLRVLRSDRRRRRREEAVVVPFNPVHDADRAEEVRALVARLPAADRAAIELHYFAGLPQAEVAMALGSSENAVALRLSRARARLRSLIGCAASVAVVTALLAAQPAHAASPQVLAGIAPLTSAVATGAALPATTVPLSAFQKGLLLMSAHPLAAAAILCAVLGAGLLPVALAAGEAHPPQPLPAVASTPPAGPQPWQGRARELLPFLDPAAPVQVAVDGAHVRHLALAAKPTSLLADPRAQPALAHICEQFRLWWAAGGGMADWAQVLAGTEGVVFGVGAHPEGKLCLVAELGNSAASQVQGVCENGLNPFGRNVPLVQVGGFNGMRIDQSSKVVVARDGGRWAMAEPGLLTAGLARRTDAVPPAGLWVRIDFADVIAHLAQLDPVDDPLRVGTLLGNDWRRLRPVLTSTLRVADGTWRAESRLTCHLPLRAVQPGIAGCVPTDAVASLLLGCDPAALSATLVPIVGKRFVRDLGFDPATLPGQLSGDLALVVRQRAPLPEVSLVIGLRPGAATSLRNGLEQLATMSGLASEPAVAPALAAWSGLLPIGAVQVRLTADRLVVSTGEAAVLLAPPPRATDAALAVDLDLPAIARTWLPQVLAMLPVKPEYFGEMTPLANLSRSIDMLRPEMIDVVGSPPSASLTAWQRLLGRADVRMQPHIGVYSGQGSQKLLVLRKADGWRLVGWNLSSYEVVADPAVLAQRLSGYALSAGTPAAELAPISFPEPPSIDRRWLPPMAAILEHLPVYRLRLQQTADGCMMSETGVPLSVIALNIAAALPWIEPDLLRKERNQAVFHRDVMALSQRHARAIAALKRIQKALASRRPDEPVLMTPAAVLTAAGIDPAEFASLCDGVTPDAERLDRLGYFHPSGWPHQHFRWLIPLGNGLFLEYGIGGHCITYSTFVPQRLPTAEELARLRNPSVAPAPAPAPEPVAPASPGDF